MRKFISTRARNEALDCRVYAYAAFVGLQPDLKKVEEKQKSLMANQVEEKVASSVKALPSKAIQPCRRSQSTQRKSSNFAHSWKSF